MNRIRVDERDLETEEPGARLLVDEIGAGAGELDQRRREIADLVRDVVHPGAPLRQKAADRGVLAQGLEQLHPSRPDAQRCSPHALVRNGRSVLDLRAEKTLVRHECRIEVLDRDTQMVDPPCSHVGDFIGRRPASGLGW